MKNSEDFTPLFREHEKYNKIDCLCEDMNVPIKDFDTWSDYDNSKDERELVRAFEKDGVV